MMSSNSELKHETSPFYVNREQMFDTDNVRLRHNKPTIPTNAAHFVLPTGDYRSNEMDHHPQLPSSYTHNKTQIFCIIFTMLVYLFYTLRTFIPDNIQTFSNFWSSIKPIPITRSYTSDLRPNLIFEQYLLHSAEIFQTLWLIYILSFLVKRTSLGYLYRNPNIFDTKLCCLLISALFFQGINQISLPPELSCACLLLSYILLIIICRLIAVKSLRYEEKFKSMDLKMIRYFVLNSLFLYTTSIGYMTICSLIECVAFHFNTDLALVTTIGLSIGLVFLIIYFLLDQFIYEDEFQSIWTPYLFLTIVSLSPLLNQFISTDTNPWNIYFGWILFTLATIMILTRIVRYKLRQCRTMKSFIPKSVPSTNMTDESFSLNSFKKTEIDL
ncbi:hypothetical protein I4U23_029043 [Adineta vaga]|nr:hypothetical protein I4U23_029043 [Adineta vaga]